MKNTFMRYTFHYISILLNYLASIYCNPWDNGVYKGFTHMCDDTFFLRTMVHITYFTCI